MSLPTRGLFVKANEIVGSGFCNVGWTLRPEYLERCMQEAWGDALSIIDQSPEQRDERYAPFFTNREALLEFDFVILYEWKIPRELFVRRFHGEDITELLQTTLELVDPDVKQSLVARALERRDD